MASARKKLDEKNLKILRELASLPGNKHCFDCGQRGPTYVNVTIGSFVCTTCSGILRGLTPPHRVKSISMATFTPEEIELLKTKGNEHCRSVWMGLYDGDQLSKDEQQVKELMIAKYEKKRYYVKPSESDKVLNGSGLRSNSGHQQQLPPKLSMSSSFSFPSGSVSVGGRNHNNNLLGAGTVKQQRGEERRTAGGSGEDLFNSRTNSGGIQSIAPPHLQHHQQQQANSSQPTPLIDNFANFENNPVFNSPPTPQPGGGGGGPTEDKYAALKDLDCLMKSQQQQQAAATVLQQQQQAAATVLQQQHSSDLQQSTTTDWDAGSLWPPLGNGFLQSGPAPQTSNLFDASPQFSTPAVSKDFNPFNNKNDGAWGDAFSSGNPFNTDFAWTTTNGPSNGLPASQSLNFNSSKPLWNFGNFGTTPNPFSVSTNGQSVSHHSSNPFL